MRRYLTQLGFSMVAILLAVAAFNVAIDPYNWFGVTRVAGVNEFALGLNHRLPLARALAVDRLQPAAVILGNSRAEAGYEPTHWPDAGPQAYNLAIGGAGIVMLARYAREAMDSGGLREMMLALDFSMFDPALLAQDIEENALMTAADGRRRGAWHSLQRSAAATLSGTALADSWWSLTHQRRPVVRYTPSGRRDDDADLAQVMREGGHRDASLRAELGFATAAWRIGEMDEPARRVANRRAFDELAKLVAAARNHGVRLTLVINPIHARQNYLLMGAGVWPTYEQWKRDLAALAAANDVAAWDFSSVSRCTSEPLPARGDSTTRMRWYRESSHFRPALGDKVLARISGGPDDSECGEFGVPLNPANIDRVLATQRQRLLDWATAHPEDAQDVWRLAAAPHPAARKLTENAP